MQWQDYKGMTETGRRIGRMAEAVKADESAFGPLSTGEKIAVALVLDRRDLMQSERFSYTMLEAIDRLGDEWLQAAILVQKAMDQ